MKFRILSFSFLLLFGLPLFSQVSTFKLHLVKGFMRRPIKNQNVKVIINDSLTKRLISDDKGETGFLEVPSGKHTIEIVVEGFKPRLLKNNRIAGATGRHLNVKLKRTRTEKTNEKSPEK